jgi:hypothetical protein
LLIPRPHFPFLAALPSELDDEFESLKALLGSFIEKHYGPVSFWENGGFGQTVPHAHLHAFSVPIEPATFRDHGVGFSGLAGLRDVHAGVAGQYFMVEHAGEAQLLPPDWDVYMRIVEHARSKSGRFVRSRDERRLNGIPINEALKRRWDAEMPDFLSSGGPSDRSSL